jgi:hypothetical protein
VGPCSPFSSFACILVGLKMHCEALTPSIGAQLAAFAKLQARHFAFLQGNRSRRPTGGAARCPPRCRRAQGQCCDGGGRRRAVCSGLHTFLSSGKYCFQVSIGQGNTSALWLRHAATNMRARPDGQAGSQWHREHKRHGWYSVYPDTPPGQATEFGVYGPPHRRQALRCTAGSAGAGAGVAVCSCQHSACAARA